MAKANWIVQVLKNDAWWTLDADQNTIRAPAFHTKKEAERVVHNLGTEAPKHKYRVKEWVPTDG